MTQNLDSSAQGDSAPVSRPVSSVVCSYNEWDPLEEVIVGVLQGATVPEWHVSLAATMPEDQRAFFLAQAGQPFPADQVAAGIRELDELVHILESEGVTVRRPSIVDHGRGYATPDWTSSSGLYAAMPRDLLLVIGDELIEVPMAWRSRFFEIHAYRELLKEYFRQGTRWTAAPRPSLDDRLYHLDYDPAHAGQHGSQYAITEHEPTFDAADFIRCGRDIVAQLSNVTNRFGVEWLTRHLGDRYRIHVLEFDDPHPMHIDATIMPLAPGRLLINPERVREVPAMFRSWDVLEAPQPSITASHTMYMSSSWVNMNLLSLDERRVIVEKDDEPMIRALADWGFEPIPCPFRNFNRFGGSFHCATLDVRRKGTLESYF